MLISVCYILDKVTKHKKIALSSIIVIVLLAFGVFILLHSSNSIVSSKKTTHPTASKQSKQSTPKSTAKSNSTTPSITTNNTPTITPAGPSNSSQTLEAPFGSFVSNNNPSLSNSSQSYELSSCETTPGATCYIKFTNAQGQNIILPSQVVDSQGVTSWGWNVNTKGFTVGTWSVTAIASLNGQDKQSIGSPLKVQQ